MGINTSLIPFGAPEKIKCPDCETENLTYYDDYDLDSYRAWEFECEVTCTHCKKILNIKLEFQPAKIEIALIMRPKITHVAIRYEGKIYSLPAPNRHHHVMSLIVKECDVAFVDVDLDDEGFLDEDGNYLNRRQALASAIWNKQVKDPDKVRARMLTSEDVW